MIAGSTAALAAFYANQFALFHIKLFSAIKLPFVEAAVAQGFAFGLLLTALLSKLVEVGGLTHGMSIRD